MRHPIGVLIAGAVRHGEDYAEVLANLDAVHITAVAEDFNAEEWMVDKAADLARHLGVPLCDLPVGLAREDSGLVLVTTEPTRHAVTAEIALDSGHHVLVDKPVATSGEQARSLAAAAIRNGKSVSCYVHRLFHPAAQRARELVDSSAVGLPLSLDLTWISPNDLLEEGGEIVVRSELSGGGEMRNFLGYPLELALWLTGLRPVQISAMTVVGFTALHQVHAADGLATVLVRLEGGVDVSICVGRGSIDGRGIFDLTLSGTHGTAILNEQFGSGIHNSKGHALLPPKGGTFESVFSACVVDVINAIELRTSPIRTLIDGSRVSALIDLAYSSAADGAPLHWSEVSFLN